jgi:RNA polymerase sigma-70 factor (ECF subfamily)
MFTENEIIDGCLKNDRKMQKALYDRYAPKLYALCLRYAYSKDEADDILQESFVKIFFQISQFSREHSFYGWLKSVAINTAITYYHHHKKHYYQDDIDEINETEIENNTIEGEYSAEHLLQVIQELPTGFRTIFNLYAIEGYKHQEIAEMLNISESTSKSQLLRARKALQTKLEQLQE